MRRRESGQATTELAIMAVAIIFVTAGMLAVGGIGISSIKSLIVTRSRAEVRASTAVSGDSSPGGDIAGWTATRVDFSENRTIQVPFLADDHKQITTVPIGTGVITDGRYSRAERDDAVGSRYSFLRLTDVPGIHVPPEMFASGSVDLVRPVTGHGVLAAESEGEDIYLLKDLQDRREFRQSLMPWLNLRRVDIAEWPSSTVVFPAFGSD